MADVPAPGRGVRPKHRLPHGVLHGVVKNLPSWKGHGRLRLIGGSPKTGGVRRGKPPVGRGGASPSSTIIQNFGDREPIGLEIIDARLWRLYRCRRFAVSLGIRRT